jgi:hypothetical protein
VCFKLSFRVCQSAQIEDKSGGWIRERKTPDKFLGFGMKLGFKAKGNRLFFFIFSIRRDIYSHARADIHIYTT